MLAELINWLTRVQTVIVFVSRELAFKGPRARQRTGFYMRTVLANNDLGPSEFSRSSFNQTIEPSKQGQTGNLPSRQHHLLHMCAAGETLPLAVDDLPLKRTKRANARN